VLLVLLDILDCTMEDLIGSAAARSARKAKAASGEDAGFG
jgi:hypothetical protein